MTPRYTLNSRPNDYRSGIVPLDSPWRGQFWRQLGVAVLAAVVFALVVLAAVAGGVV